MSVWTDGEEQALRNLWATERRQERIYALLGKTKGDVDGKASELLLPQRKAKRATLGDRYVERKRGERARDCMCCRKPFPSEGVHNRFFRRGNEAA